MTRSLIVFPSVYMRLLSASTLMVFSCWVLLSTLVYVIINYILYSVCLNLLFIYIKLTFHWCIVMYWLHENFRVLYIKFLTEIMELSVWQHIFLRVRFDVYQHWNTQTYKKARQSHTLCLYITIYIIFWQI